ncbi:MAG: hypothetical protein ACOC9T_03025 [Myxococcota bacterium]
MSSMVNVGAACKAVVIVGAMVVGCYEGHAVEQAAMADGGPELGNLCARSCDAQVQCTNPDLSWTFCVDRCLEEARAVPGCEEERAALRGCIAERACDDDWTGHRGSCDSEYEADRACRSI